MANNERIDQIIDPKAIEQFEKFQSQLRETTKLFADNVAAASDFNESLGKGGGVKKFKKDTDDTGKAIEKIRKDTERAEKILVRQSLEQEKAFNNYLKGIDKQIKASERRERISEINHKRELSRANTEAKQTDANSKRITEQSRVYIQLSNTLERLRKDAQDVGAVFGTNSFQFKRAADQVNNLDLKLKDIDKQLGKSQRFVGEYERAGGRTFNGLSNSINQLTREFPAFTFSVQTGFLALSNNIPIFFDEIARTRNEIKLLRDQGKEVPGLFKQLTSSVLSWGTALSLAVTILTVFGKEIGNFIGSIFEGTEALDKFTIAQNERNRQAKAYNDTLLEGNKNAVSEIVNLDLTKKAIENQNVPLRERNILVDNLQKEYPKYFKNLTNEQILAGNVGNAYKLLKDEIIAASLARAAQDRIVENSQRQLENEDKILSARRERIKLQRELEQQESRRTTLSDVRAQSFDPEGAIGQQIVEQRRISSIKDKIAATDKIIYNATTDTNKLNADNLRLIQKIGDEVEKNGAGILTGGVGALEDQKKINDGLLQLELFRAQNLASINASIVSDANKTEEERFVALEKSVQARQRIIEVERKIALDNDDLTANDRIRIQEEFIAKSNQLTIDGNAEALDIATDNITKQDKLRFEAQEKAINDISIQRDEELKALEIQFQSGLITREEYEKKRLDLARFYSDQEILEQIRQTEAIIALQKSRGQNVSNEEAKIAALKLKYSKDVTDAQIEDLKRVEDAEKKLKDLQKELAGEIFNLTEGLFNAGFEKRLQGIDKELEKNEEKAEFERQQVEDSLSTEEEKEIRLAQIEANAQGKREQLEARQRRIAVQQARFGKAVDSARIISQTALAVISALTPPPVGFGPIAGIPIAATIGAIGAAQLAQVLATPIPAFKHGKDKSNNYEGIAFVGDGGQSELVINPDGSAWVTPSVPTLTHVSKDTEVISGPEFKKIMAFQSLADNGVSSKVDNSDIIAAVKDQTGKTINAIKNSGGKGTTISRRGWRNTHNTTNGYNEYISRNFG